MKITMLIIGTLCYFVAIFGRAEPGVFRFDVGPLGADINWWPASYRGVYVVWTKPGDIRLIWSTTSRS